MKRYIQGEWQETFLLRAIENRPGATSTGAVNVDRKDRFDVGQFDAGLDWVPEPRLGISTVTNPRSIYCPPVV